MLGAADSVVQALERIDLTSAQKRDERFYPPNAVVVFNQKVRDAEPGAKGKLAEEYLRLAELESSAVVVSQTWGEVHRVNSHVRDALKSKGLLGANDTTVQVLDKLDQIGRASCRERV